jgi:hypothetical protein
VISGSTPILAVMQADYVTSDAAKRLRWISLVVRSEISGAKQLDDTQAASEAESRARREIQPRSPRTSFTVLAVSRPATVSPGATPTDAAPGRSAWRRARAKADRCSRAGPML